MQLAVSNLHHPFALPDGATAELLHPLREDDLEAGLVEHGNHLVDQCLLLLRLRGETHGLVDATGEIDYLTLRRVCLGIRLVGHRGRHYARTFISIRFRHGGEPLRDAQRMMHTLCNAAHQTGAYQAVSCISQAQNGA